MLAQTTLPLDGEYVIQPRCSAPTSASMRGLEYAHQLEITVDGERVHLASIRRRRGFQGHPEEPDEGGRRRREARSRARVPLTAGPHTIGVAFIEQTAAQNQLRLQPFIRSSHDTLDPTGYPHIDVFTVTGPFNPTGSGDTPSRRRIFIVPPGDGGRGRAVRAQHHLDARAPRLSRAGHRRRHRSG